MLQFTSVSLSGIAREMQHAVVAVEEAAAQALRHGHTQHAKVCLS